MKLPYTLLAMNFIRTVSLLQNFRYSPIRHLSTMTERLEQVEGLTGKFNDILLHSTPASPVESDVVYFGGDVQDYKENMLQHRDNHRYAEWSLEDTAIVLSKRFPASNIWIVKPSKMHLKTFSVYANFVESNDFGNPTHEEGHGSWLHLDKLLTNARDILREKSKVSCDSNSNSAKIPPLILCGFSKGCIVLNQLLYDLKKARSDDENLSQFVSKVKEFYWLDGAHSGGKITWVTDEEILSNLVSLDVKINCHVSPYQVKDPMRSWIGKEQKKFVKILRKLGVTVTSSIHFEHDKPSIDNHFRVLLEF